MKRTFLVAFLVVVAGCSETPAVSTSETTATSSATTEGSVASTPSTTTTLAAQAPEVTTTTVTPIVPSSVEGTFDVVLLDIVGGERLIALADTTELRQQGLMFVEDMADLDGMLFVFENESAGGFWMKNTLIHLDIAFFDSDGVFVDGFEMEPCTTANCPSYKSSGAYRYALEMAAGDMPDDVATGGLGQLGDL